jgi:SHS2 domain-containing protein
MGTFKFLEHTADEKIAIVATSYEDLFQTAIKAIYETMLGKKEVKSIQTKEFSLENKKITTLLYDFINEFIILFDEESLLLPNIQSLTIKNENNMYKLNVKVSGDKVKNYEIENQIKNMTYSDMIIEEKNNQIHAQIVVDI